MRNTGVDYHMQVPNEAADRRVAILRLLRALEMQRRAVAMQDWKMYDQWVIAAGEQRKIMGE